MTTNTHILWRRPKGAPGFETDASTETIHPLQGMDSPQAVEKFLSRNSLLQLVGDHTGESITCQNGVAWITQSGDPQDILLCPGESFLIPQRSARKGTVLVQALVKTHLKITRLRI